MAQYEMKSAVTEQPAGVMSVQGGLHPSLVYLVQLDRLVVLKTKRFEYQILNAADQVIFEITADLDLTCRCCSTPPDFLWHIFDMKHQEVCLLRLPYAGCTSLPSTYITECPPGITTGYTTAEFGCCTGQYIVYDKDNRQIFSVDRPQMYSRAMDMPILNNSDQAVGNINIQKSQWSRYFTFTVSFPVNLEVGMKLNLLGTILMLDRTMFNRNR